LYVQKFQVSAATPVAQAARSSASSAISKLGTTISPISARQTLKLWGD
jgi:hypothetical protein